jgi:hypothetical protein
MQEGLENALVSVWRQVLVEERKDVQLAGRRYPVRRTPRQRLRQVDFSFAAHELRGLEQNPSTRSRWARLAREGKKVMQFLEGRRYLAAVADGKVIAYGDR